MEIIVFAIWIMGMCFLSSKVSGFLKAEHCSETCSTWVLVLLWVISFIILTCFLDNLRSEERSRGFYEAMETREEWNID